MTDPPTQTGAEPDRHQGGLKTDYLRVHRRSWSAEGWGTAEVSVFEPVSVALEGDDFDVVDERVDHGGWRRRRRRRPRPTGRRVEFRRQTLTASATRADLVPPSARAALAVALDNRAAPHSRLISQRRLLKNSTACSMDAWGRCSDYMLTHDGQA